MPILHHASLAQEFPEYKEAIHTLKSADAHFEKLLSKYEELTKQIYRIEEAIEHASDHALEDLKKRRLALKDELFSAVTKTAV